MGTSELKALMQPCNALVAPSRGEGFGLPIAEAMLSGLPSLRRVTAGTWTSVMPTTPG